MSCMSGKPSLETLLCCMAILGGKGGSQQGETGMFLCGVCKRKENEAAQV